MKTGSDPYLRRFFTIIFMIVALAASCSLSATTDSRSSAGMAQGDDIVSDAPLSSSVGSDIGAFVGINPPTATAIKGFEHLSGRHVNSVMWYQGWDASSQPPFPISALNSEVRYHDGYNTHTILHLTWEPWVKLSDIANGTYDSYLTSYANQSRKWGERIHLRFAHEMIQDNVYNDCQDQPACPEWYPWQDQPADYIAAFRHVHDVFKTADAANVEFVWCPNNYPFDINIVQQYYPGQDYVDWLCVDGYNPTNKDGLPGYPDWYWFDDIFYPIYHTFIDHKDIFGDKPIMIGEFASCEAGPYEQPGQTKSAWITNAFDRIKSLDYAQIKSFYWFNINKECDWRINSSTQSLISLQTALSDPYFISHPGQIFSSAGYYDGWILESSETSNSGGALNATDTTFNLGDNGADRQYRAVLSFDTAALPETAHITSVTIKLKLKNTIGTSPFKTHGNLLVDVRKGAFGSNALQLTDFQASASRGSVGEIPMTPVGGWYAKTWNNNIFNYINRAGITQFRLRFAKDDNDDLGADYLKFYSGNASAAYQPQLIVEYYVP